MRIFSAAIIATLPQLAIAAEEDAKAASIMWAAFKCGTYAEMSGDPERQIALFERGVAAGKQFFLAVEAGTITRDEHHKHVPLSVLGVAAGPSVDFVLGRSFESAMRSAFEDVVKTDLAGMPLPMDKWTNDNEVRQSKAQLLYSRSNCHLF
jgi:hypothetical protein